MPSAPTTAPEVSPPATTSLRTPIGHQALGDLGQRLLDQRPCALDADLALCGLHVVRRRRGVDQHRLRPHPNIGPVQRLARYRLPRRQLARIDAQGGSPRLHPERDLAVGGDRAAARQHGRMTRHARQRRGRGGMPEPAGAGVLQRDAQPHAGARRHQRQLGAALGDAGEVGLGQRIGDGDADAVLPQRRDPRAHRRRALRQRVVADEAHLAPRLRLQHAHEVGVRHRRERMVLHAGLGQQHVADEQVAAADGAPGLGERRAGDREVRRRAHPSARR